MSSKDKLIEFLKSAGIEYEEVPEQEFLIQYVDLPAYNLQYFFLENGEFHSLDTNNG